MGIERIMWRGMFAPEEVVLLKQVCFTPGKIFEPGKYIVGELPDIAFEMGLVEQLPAVQYLHSFGKTTKNLVMSVLRLASCFNLGSRLLPVHRRSFGCSPP